MRKVIVPDSANSSVQVSLGGQTYTFEYTYSKLNEKFYLKISYNGEVLISNLKLNQNVYLLKKHAIPEFDHGDLMIVKLKGTDAEVTRDNLGINKAYSLIYLSNEEIAEYL